MRRKATIVLLGMLLMGISSSRVMGQEYGLTFDGDNDWASAPVMTQNGETCLEAWVKWDGTSGSQVLIYNGRTDASGYGFLLDGSTGVLTLLAGGVMISNPGPTLPVGSWCHIAAVNTGGNFYIYKNGTGQWVMSGSANAPNTYFLFSKSDQSFHGSIKEVRLSTIARYTSSFTPSAVLGTDANTWAYYRLNDGSGQATADGSGNGRNGQLGTTSGVDADDPTWLDGSLSVSLTSFSAHQQGAAVLLNWVSESECDNAGYILERKAEGADWQTIASYETHAGLAGQGNTSERTEYTFVDEDAACGQTYAYRLSDVNRAGAVTMQDVISITLDVMPESTVLKPAYPNPFNPATKIQYELAEQTDVTLKVVDIRGRLVQRIVPGETKVAGVYSIHWNGRDEAGIDAASGVYFLVLEAGGVRKTQKVMLVR